jgi:TolA-binding protein
VLGKVVFFFALIIAAMIGFHTVLQNGSLLRYFDAHPHPKFVPAAEFVIGQGQFIFQDLPEAATYFTRIAERYPDSRYADDALFGKIQCLDDMGSTPRATLIEEYEKYLERFPKGTHVATVQTRLDGYRSGSR